MTINSQVNCQLYLTVRVVTIVTTLRQRLRPKTDTGLRMKVRNELENAQDRLGTATARVPLCQNAKSQVADHGVRLADYFKITVSRASCTVGSIDLLATARSDDCLLAYREPNFQQWAWKAASEKLSVIDNVIGALEFAKRSLQGLDQTGFDDLDDKTIANLEYLLLRIRECLAQTTVSKAWRFIKNSVSKHHHPMGRLFKYGGDKWCSEYSGNQRPMSTTWPWSILPSLAVIWGVCWMFAMKSEYSSWYWPAPGHVAMEPVPGGLHPSRRHGSSSFQRPPVNGPPYGDFGGGLGTPANPNHPTSGNPSFHASLIHQPPSPMTPSLRPELRGASFLLPQSSTSFYAAQGPPPSAWSHPDAFESVNNYITTLSYPNAPVAARTQQLITVQNSGESPGGAFADPYNSPPNSADMNADTLAAEATAVLDGREELSASLQPDTHMDDSLDGEGLDGFTPRRGHTLKRTEEPPKNEEGKMICRFQSTCAGLAFDRRCEWSKHMDKHERPYKCEATGCEKLQGFTYSGGLLRHQREVHKMHGGTKDPLYCPFATCKRSQGTGFTRKENRDEHVRRVHRRATDGADLLNGKRPHDAIDTTDPLLQDSVLSTGDGTDDITNENLDPNVDSPLVTPAAKRRRLQPNGNSMLDSLDSDIDIKATVKRLQESNTFLLQQNQNLRKDYQQLFERMSRLEDELGAHLVSGVGLTLE